jgi:hypothetical protein
MLAKASIFLVPLHCTISSNSSKSLSYPFSLSYLLSSCLSWKLTPLTAGFVRRTFPLCLSGNMPECGLFCFSDRVSSGKPFSL